MSTPSALPERLMRKLRTLSGALRPVVRVGHKGWSLTVQAELEAALLAHELVKIKLPADRENRKALLATITSANPVATVVMHVGHVLCLYQRHPTQPRVL